MMHRGNYKEINKIIFYTINNPSVVKKWLMIFLVLVLNM
jgi:hypothetical protein